MIEQTLAGLPILKGLDIELEMRPHLVVHRGKLMSGITSAGKDVHAASFIRDRRIVIDSLLVAYPSTLRLILVHEIFHFTWSHLGNPWRRDFARLVQRELHCGARGELGESAAVSKVAVLRETAQSRRDKRWPEYVSESFCDTAAWLYSGTASHPDFELAERWREKRRQWFQRVFSTVRAC